MKILSCAFNMDTACVELKTENGRRHDDLHRLYRRGE